MPSPNPHSDRLLHRLVDGDLEDAERVALLSTQGEARDTLVAKLEGLGEVRALVRAAADAELKRASLDAEAMWAQISARVEGSRESLPGTIASPEPSAPSKPALQVIRGGRAQERVDPQMDERQKRVRSRRLGMMLVGGLAAAAAIAIIYLNPLGDAPTEVATNDVPPVVAPALGELASAELQQTEVLAVDFGTNVGTVFSVEGDEGARYAVVWLADEGEQDEHTDDGVGADHGTKGL